MIWTETLSSFPEVYFWLLWAKEDLKYIMNKAYSQELGYGFAISWKDPERMWVYHYSVKIEVVLLKERKMDVNSVAT